MTEESTPQGSVDSEPSDPASINAEVESLSATNAIPDATAPAVIVNVGVNETVPNENENPVAEAETVVAPAEDAIASAEETAVATEEDAGQLLEEDVAEEVPQEPTELESLQVERERASLETVELQNERLAIENDAMREDIERRADDAAQQIEVTPDGRSAETTDAEGQRETRSSAAGSGESATDSGNGSAESKAGTSNRSSGREPRGSKRFKRGRH